MDLGLTDLVPRIGLWGFLGRKSGGLKSAKWGPVITDKAGPGIM